MNTFYTLLHILLSTLEILSVNQPIKTQVWFIKRYGKGYKTGLIHFTLLNTISSSFHISSLHVTYDNRQYDIILNGVKVYNDTHTQGPLVRR